nr:hypothetical protein [Tanacetum cinerariifolium]
MGMQVKEAKKNNEAGKEEMIEVPSSQPIEYYWKHSINKKLIEGLVDNRRILESLCKIERGVKNDIDPITPTIQPMEEENLKSKHPNLVNMDGEMNDEGEVTFTLRDGESIESYYSRFYNMMNEMVRNQLEVATMQVNVQFLQQFQPEWSRFVTIVKQTIEMDKESYHDLFDILKQYQKEVNEIYADKIATNAQRDKKIQKNLALIAKYFKKIYKPTNNNIRYSSNTRNKNVDNSLRYRNDHQTGQFGNKRTVTVVSDWLDDMDKEIDEQELEAHYSFMAKIQEVLTAESGYGAKPLEKVQSNVEYNVFANERQHSKQPESINDTYVVEKVDSNVIPNSSDMCDNDNQADQNTKKYDDERVMLANLISYLKLDTDENKNIQMQLKKAKTSLSHELKDASLHLKSANLVLRGLIELEIDI